MVSSWEERRKPHGLRVPELELEHTRGSAPWVALFLWVSSRLLPTE